MKKLNCLWLLLLTSLALAQTSTEFFIESIVVEGNVRGAEALIVAQTRLTENQTYSEGDLRASMNRLQLQPFVLDANFKIERGSAKGKYQLRIKVQIQRRFFAQVRSSYGKSDLFPGNWSDFLQFGANHFFGKHSQVYAAIFPGWTWLDSGQGLVTGNIGYTNYHLFGSNLLLNIDLEFTESFEGFQNQQFIQEFESDPVASLNLSYYLGRNQWLQGTFRRGRTEEVFGPEYILVDGNQFDPENPPGREMVVSSYSLSWERNTTDDSWEATKGSLYRVGTRRNRGDVKGINLEFPRTQDSESWVVFLDYAKFHQLNFRHVLSYSGGVRYGEVASGINQDSRTFQASGTYKVQLFDSLTQYRFGDAFFGVNLAANDYKATGRNFLGTFESKSRIQSIGLFLTYRGRWGIVRLSATYSFLD